VSQVTRIYQRKEILLEELKGKVKELRLKKRTLNLNQKSITMEVHEQKKY